MGHALCVCSRGTVVIDNKRYLFIQKLGEGGFSYVDLVEGLHDGHFYALKRILCHEQQDREEAQREADMHHLFNHPNVLHLVAYCLRERGAKHEAWLLLPFFKASCPEMSRSFLLPYRDLKPTNILLGDDGQPVLMDLGSMNQACIHVEGSRQALTLQDWAAQRCTISYRAPELFSVQSHCVIDERTDVWAFFSIAAAPGLDDDRGPTAASSHSSTPQSAGGATAPSSWPAHYPNLKKQWHVEKVAPYALERGFHPSLESPPIPSRTAFLHLGVVGSGQSSQSCIRSSAFLPLRAKSGQGALLSGGGWGLGKGKLLGYGTWL
ncbi:serine/threonine-protein kinase 16 isoform X2 [Saimiri boliviensis]|uniref:serine/threonine-protein kinase 16 isoform X2 n=1 Tax=Saimiri boliviensis TaxID=27679 RepID=UPI000533CE05|nr:serine/threonine-protein kinase 16 isoform X2 [Saimiri boliviensis boliviensis]